MEEYEMLSLDEILEPELIGHEDFTDEEKRITKNKQRQVIQSGIEDNIIVKENEEESNTLLLYRTAFLVFALKNARDSSNILVLTDKDKKIDIIRNDLNKYINEKISISTLDSFVKEYIGTKSTITPRKIESIFNYLTFEECIRLLNNFKNDYYNDLIVNESLMVDDQVLFSKEEVLPVLFRLGKDAPNFDYARNYFNFIYRKDYESIKSRLNAKYAQVYKRLPMGDPEREIAVKKSTALTRTLKEDGIKLIRDYFKKLDKSTARILGLFIENIDKYMGTSSELIENYKEETLKLLRKHKIPEDTVFLMLYLEYIMNKDKEIKKKHIILDNINDNNAKLAQTIKLISKNTGVTLFTTKEESNEINSFEIYDLTNPVKIKQKSL